MIATMYVCVCVCVNESLPRAGPPWLGLAAVHVHSSAAAAIPAGLAQGVRPLQGYRCERAFITSSLRVY